MNGEHKTEEGAADGGAVDLDSEHAGSLAELLAGAAVEDQMAQQQTTQVAQAAAQACADLGNELNGLITTLVMVAGPLFPSLKDVYTPEVTAAAAGSIAAVCAKHGWLQDGVMGQWGPEISAAVVLLPLGFSTYKAVSNDLAVMTAKREAEENKAKGLTAAAPAVLDIKPDGQQQAQGGAGADRVTVGAVVPA